MPKPFVNALPRSLFVFLATLAFLLDLAGPQTSQASTAVLFGNGDELTPYGLTNLSLISAVRASGFNTMVIFTMGVDANGNFNQSSQIICSNGVYTGDPTWGGLLAQCRVAPTSVTRIEMCIGAWGDQSFLNIKNRIAADGSGTNTVLYKNLQALKSSLGLDAIDYDDEYEYDSSSAISFGSLCGTAGLKVTLCPYTNPSYWKAVKSGLGSTVDYIYLQCYSGGAGNDSASWSSSLGVSTSQIMPGDWDSDPQITFLDLMQTGAREGCVGGFYWPLNSGGNPPASASTLLTFASLIHIADGPNLYWQGGNADFNAGTNWAGSVIPGTGANAINDSGSNNLVQINSGDPTWTVNSLWAGDEPNKQGAFVQNGSTVNVGTSNGWFRLGDSSGGTGYYTLNSGTLNISNNLHVGEVGAGVFKLNGGTLNIASAADFDVGDTGSAGSVIQSNGVVNCNGQLWVGENAGAGTYTLAGGTLNVHNYLVLGRSGGHGTMVMTGGTITQDTTGNFLVGTGYSSGSSVALLQQSGGTINCSGQFLIPEDSTSTGTYNLSGTGALNCNNWIAIGRDTAIGVLNLSGGVITKSDGNSEHIDIGAGGPGTLNQTGGLITNTTSDFWLGETTNATWNMNGGTAVLGKLVIGVNAGVNATNNLNGGLQTVTQVATGNAGATSILNFNGGTLQAAANNTTFISGLTAAHVLAGGAVLDSSNFSITIPQILTNGGGGLTKLGAGMLTLTAKSILSGTTFVKAGTLVIGSSGSLSNVNYCSIGQTGSDNGTFAIQLNGSFATASDLNMGDVGASVGTLNLVAGGTCAASAIFVGSANATNSTASGTFNQTNGAVTTTSSGDPALCLGGRNSGSSLGAGIYNFYGGTLNMLNGGNFWLGGYGTGVMKMTAGSALLSGYVSVGRWPGGTGNLVVSGGVFSQTNTGRFLIIGEQGAGTLTVSNSGQVMVNGSVGLRLAHAAGGVGTVNLGSGTPGGGMVTVPAISMGGGASSTFNFNGGTLVANAASTAFMAGLTSANVKSGGALINDGGYAITFAQPLLNGGGSGGLTKNGLGITTLSGANTYAGPTLINAGTLALGGTGSIGDSALITVRSNTTFDVSANPGFALGAAQTLTGGGVINGNLNALAGSTINPGDSIGTLTVQGNVSLAGRLIIELNRNYTQNCDQLVSSGGITVAGATLMVTNLGPALQLGDTFQVFTNPVTGFGAISLPVVSPYGWANKLAVNGTITVSPVSTVPTNLTAQVVGTSLTLAWPTDHTGWQLQAQTNNPTAGLGTNWTPVIFSSSTNQLTIPIDPANASVLYRLIYNP